MSIRRMPRRRRQGRAEVFAKRMRTMRDKALDNGDHVTADVCQAVAEALDSVAYLLRVEK